MGWYTANWMCNTKPVRYCIVDPCCDEAGWLAIISPHIQGTYRWFTTQRTHNAIVTLLLRCVSVGYTWRALEMSFVVHNQRTAYIRKWMISFLHKLPNVEPSPWIRQFKTSWKNNSGIRRVNTIHHFSTLQSVHGIGPSYIDTVMIQC